MTILHIETSTQICSVAVSHKGKLIFDISDNEGMNHAKKLNPFIDKALQIIKKEKLSLSAVAVSAGPGSYTGLRIGVSAAKGLCFGFDIPLIVVPTLEILTQGAIDSGVIDINEDILFCPMLDARRMEVYTALYNANFDLVEEVHPHIIDESFLERYLNEKKVYLFGNGSDKAKELVTHSNAHFIDGVESLAKNMIILAENRFVNHNFADLAYFEPIYLKDFIATIPKKLF